MYSRGCTAPALLLGLALVFTVVPSSGSAADIPPERASREELRAKVEEDYQEVVALWKQKDYVPAIAILEQLEALPGIGDLDNARGAILYMIGCGYALLGETGKSLDALREAVGAGFADPNQLLSDPDLEPVRSTDGFQRLLAQARAAARTWSSPVFELPYEDDLDADAKVAGLARLWAEVKYGFAHFDQVPELDWDRLFVETIPDVRATTSTADYYRVLMKLCAKLHDGHTSVDVPDELFRSMYSRPAIDTRLIDGRVYVVAVLEDAQHEAGIRPGLEIVSLDGIPVHEYADTRVAPYCSASTPQGAEVLNYSYYLLCGAPEDDVKLELRDETGALSTATLPRNFHRILSAEPFAFRILDGGIAYVAINSFGSRAQVAAFDSVFSELEETDALIIDLRRNAGGNSDVGYDILASLTREAFPTHRARAPVYEALVRAQGRPQRWDDVSPATWPPAARCYAKPTAVLIGPETGSAAEDFCVTFAAMQRGPLIGMPTAGTTGQPLRFPLPGGGSGRVCTCDCVGPDGTEYVGKGVQPDIAVHTTAANLRAGLDAELEAAMKKLRGASEN